MSDEAREGVVCSTCGTLVLDIDRHRHWHEELAASIAKAARTATARATRRPR